MKRAKMLLFSLPFAALGVAMACSYKNNHALRAETAEIVAKASNATVGDPDELGPLANLRAHVAKLHTWKESGPPISYRWGIYAGNDLYEPARDTYVAILDDAFARPAKAQLEDELHAIAKKDFVLDDEYVPEFNRLMAYLGGCEAHALDDVGVEEESLALARAWTRAVRPTAGTQEAVVPYFKDYIELARRKAVRGWSCEEGLTTSVRSVLLRFPPADRQMFALIREANEKVSSITRESVFGRTAVGFYVTSQTTPEIVVAGGFTRAGWETYVRDGLAKGRARELALERWVLRDPSLAPTLSAREQLDVRDRYFRAYTRAWKDFLDDLAVRLPATLGEALDELRALGESPWPYLTLLRLVDDNTQLEEDPSSPRAKRPERFWSLPERAFLPLVQFGAPAAGPVPLLEYQDRIVARVVADLSDRRDLRSIFATFEDAIRATNELLNTSQDDFTRPILSKLLLNPLRFEESRNRVDYHYDRQRDWEVAVWEKWREELATAYPFADSWNDARLGDFTEFFAPGGFLFGFYDGHLKGSLDRVGDRYVPAAGLSYARQFLACYERGREIADATFPAGRAAPRVDLELNLREVSDGISEVSIDVDGAHQSYTTTPGPRLAISWPVRPTESILAIRGADGLDERIVRPGVWGLFRLLDAARKIERSADGFVVTWALRSRSGYVKLDLRSPTNEKLFASYVTRGNRLFAPYDCPRDITSR